MNYFFWFWKESAKFTNYRGIKLFIKGFIPCIKFMYYNMVEGKRNKCEIHTLPYGKL
jgi:hypothetical protein